MSGKRMIICTCLFIILGVICMPAGECHAYKYCRKFNLESETGVLHTNRNKKKIRMKKWNPKSAARKANSKLHRQRKKTLRQFLMKQKKEKKIANREYKMYYPTAGAGYLKVYVHCNLYNNVITNDEGKDVAFRRSEDVVTYLVNIYDGLENCQYYDIQYKGKVKKKKNYYYVFYLYNAGERD